MPNVKNLTEQQLRNWIATMPDEPFSWECRAELQRRGLSVN